MKMTDLFDENGKPRRLIDIEREQLEVLWKKCNGNVAKIASIMNVTRKQAYRRLYKTGLYTPKDGEYAEVGRRFYQLNKLVKFKKRS